MKLVKSLLLGSATALMAVSGANAADLGVKKPSPVEYVKVCNTYGSGFFFIPGSNTCLKIGGRVRAEYYFGEPRHQGFNANSNNGFRAQGHIQLDGRTATEYGTLRTFVRLLLNSRTGNAISGTQPRYGLSTVATGADFNGQAQTNLDFTAFVQFAGFTVGRTGSFFDFYTGDLNWQGTLANGISTITGNTNLFAYTHSFGGGFTATLSLEDAILRRQIIGAGRDNTTALGSVNPSTRAPLGTAASLSNSSFYGGSQLPDIVGNVRLEQAWGSAQVAAALHEVTLLRVSNALQAGAGTGLLGSTGNLADANGAAIDRDYGYAFQGGVKVNLPFIASGDTLWINAAYGVGAAGFANAGGAGGSGNFNSSSIDGYVAQPIIDGYVYGGADRRARVSLSETFSIFAGVEHFWTPTIRQSLFGAWGFTSYERIAVPTITSGAIGGGITRIAEFQVGSRLVWSPVKDLDIGVEVQYNYIQNNLRAANFAGGVFPLNVRNTSDSIIGRFRVQRDF